MTVSAKLVLYCFGLILFVTPTYVYANSVPSPRTGLSQRSLADLDATIPEWKVWRRVLLL